MIEVCVSREVERMIADAFFVEADGEDSRRLRHSKPRFSKPR
jgi:hypothetical protein